MIAKLSALLCRILGHTATPWEMVPDRFLEREFDPSGIHHLHSHYRPHARWLIATDAGFDITWHNRCRRCKALIWEFQPHPPYGERWGKPDSYEHRLAALEFERDFYGVPMWRVS